MLVSPLAADHQSHNSYAEFEDDFDDVERQCTALYDFQGTCQSVLRSALLWHSHRRASALFVSLAGVASLQATTRAPSPSRRRSSWVWWRRIKETAGWGSSGATGMRAIYLHPTLNPTRNTRTLSLSLSPSERTWAQMKGEHGANGTASCCSSQSRWCCAVRCVMNGWS